MSAPNKRSAGERKVAKAVLGLAGKDASLPMQSSSAWASILLSGVHHRIVIDFTDFQSGERFINLLPEHEFEVAGLIFADAAVTDVVFDAAAGLTRVSCELLVVNQ